MRIPDLRKKIITNFSVAALLLVIFGIILNFYLHQETNVKIKVDKIKSETDRIKNETIALESKTFEVKKYKEIWQKLSSNRTMIASIKVDDFNSKLSATAEKYSISNLNLKISLPEPLQEGAFKRDTLEIMFTTVNLNFTSLSDTKALSFANEFIGSLHGYPIITYFELKKAKDYDDQDFENISSGKNTGVVSGRIDFFWYVYKEKSEPEVKITHDKPRTN